MIVPGANSDNTAVLLAVGYDGEVIGMMSDDEVSSDDIVAWLHRIADDMEKEGC